MPLLSASDDLVLRTLKRLPSPIHGLVYLGHRCREAPAIHWGMARTYGAATTSSAFSQAHWTVAQEILRSDLRNTGTAWLQSLPANQTREQLAAVLRVADLLPQRLSRLEAKQLRLILDVLIETTPQGPPSPTART